MGNLQPLVLMQPTDFKQGIKLSGSREDSVMKIIKRAGAPSL